MIICLCYGISDTKIQETIKAGAKTVKEVQTLTKAGTGCGSCIYSIKKLIQQEYPSQETTEILPPGGHRHN